MTPNNCLLEFDVYGMYTLTDAALCACAAGSVPAVPESNSTCPNVACNPINVCIRDLGCPNLNC